MPHHSTSRYYQLLLCHACSTANSLKGRYIDKVRFNIPLHMEMIIPANHLTGAGKV